MWFTGPKTKDCVIYKYPLVEMSIARLKQVDAIICFFPCTVSSVPMRSYQVVEVHLAVQVSFVVGQDARKL